MEISKRRFCEISRQHEIFHSQKFPCKVRLNISVNDITYENKRIFEKNGGDAAILTVCDFEINMRTMKWKIGRKDVGTGKCEGRF